MKHAIFTEDGIPRWFGAEPVKGSVPLDPKEFLSLLGEGLTEDQTWARCVAILVTHRRLPGGNWVPREPVPPPTPEETAAYEAELARQAAQAAEAEAATRREDEILRRTLPYMHQRSEGTITIAQYKAHAARIRAEVEADL